MNYLDTCLNSFHMCAVVLLVTQLPEATCLRMNLRPDALVRSFKLKHLIHTGQDFTMNTWRSCIQTSLGAGCPPWSYMLQNPGGKAGGCQFESLSFKKLVSGPLKPFQGKLENAGVDDAQLLRSLFAPGRICMFATNQLNALPYTYMSMLESFSQHEPRLAKKIFAQLPPLVGVLFHSSAAAMKIAGEWLHSIKVMIQQSYKLRQHRHLGSRSCMYAKL